MLQLFPSPIPSTSHPTRTQFLPAFPSLHTAPSASTSSTLFRPPVLQKSPDYDSRLTSLQNEKAALRDDLNQHMVAFRNSGKALKEEPVARRVMVSALGSLQSQVSDLKAQNFSSEELNQGLMQNALSEPHKKNRQRNLIISLQQFLPVCLESL